MDQLEKVEKIREKTGVTYEEAKAALDAAGGDVLDALVYLESKGKIKEPEISVYTTKEEPAGASEAFQQAARSYEASTRESFGDHVKEFIKWCGKLVKKGCENFFIISKNGEELATLPVLVMILFLLFAFWVTLPVLIAGLFLGFKYSFRGTITQAVDVNTACEKAAEAAETIKQEFKK